jgi:hypothetical protein
VASRPLPDRLAWLGGAHRHLLRARHRAGPLLERLKNWLAENNAVNMAVLMLIIGVKLIGDPITGLSS